MYLLISKYNQARTVYQVFSNISLPEKKHHYIPNISPMIITSKGVNAGRFRIIV